MKLTQYQQYLHTKGYIGISSDRGWKYLTSNKCPFCDNHNFHFDVWERIDGHERINLLCNECDKIIGVWYNLTPKAEKIPTSRPPDKWTFTPTENTDIFRQRFDIKRKIRDVLIGASA